MRMTSRAGDNSAKVTKRFALESFFHGGKGGWAPDFATLDQLFYSSDLLRNRNGPRSLFCWVVTEGSENRRISIGPVDLVQVDVISLQPFQ